MVGKALKVRLDDLALSQLKQACNYIKKDSPKNSLKVRKDVFSACMALATYPDKCAMDKYKQDNDGSYRAFELHHYRVSYRILASEVKILRLRHTSKEPLEY